MSLLWFMIAGILYAEILVLIMLLLPFISPLRWNRLFRSQILQSLREQTALYFYGLSILLMIVLIDAIREIRKYSSEEYKVISNPKAEMQGHMKLFRAQRNFYISSFVLLLSAIIRRLTTLLSTQASLMAENEAVLNQFANAAAAATEIEAQLNSLKEEFSASLRDKEVLKSQAENVNKDFDRLLKEHERLQKKQAKVRRRCI